MKRVYLDIAAGAPVGKAALRAYTKALTAYGNPSSSHEEGREAKRLLEQARSIVARLAGMKAEQVYFTGSATEANNLALLGHAKAVGKGAFLYNAGAHASIVECMQELSRSGFPTAEIPLKDGALDLEVLKTLITPETTMVSLEAASSETGVRFDTRKVRMVLDELRPVGTQKIWLHVDASQLPLQESFERTRLGADLLTLDAQKVGGMRGIGALLSTSLVPLAPIMHGGGQERGLRSGTPSPALATAFAVALEEAAKVRRAFAEKAKTQREILKALLLKEIPTISIQEGKQQLPHLLNIALVGRDTDYLVALLDEAGFAVATRSSCETDSEDGSRAVLALSGDASLARSTLRISWGPDTTTGELQRFAHALIRSVLFLDQQG